MLSYEKPNKAIQIFLFKKAFIVKIGNKSNTEAIKSLRYISMGKIIFHYTVDTFIGRRYADIRMSNQSARSYSGRNGRIM